MTSRGRSPGSQGRVPGRWGRLLTEQQSPRSRRLDTMTTEHVVGLVLDEDRRGVVAARRTTAAIARAARLLAETLDAGHDVVLLGAGTSGRLGVLEAAELPPTFGIAPGRVRATMAGGRGSVFKSREGAEDRADDGRRQGRLLASGDLLVGISASSVTPFVRAALEAARSVAARTVLLTCAPSRGLARLADVVVALDTGPEVLTGSTRLKAGSATKAALNALTTAAMVRLGKVYENLMVDLRPASAKLVDRSRRIVSVAGGVDERRARRLLAATRGDVKAAIVMARRGVSAREAHALLDRAGGHVRRALRLRYAP